MKLKNKMLAGITGSLTLFLFILYIITSVRLESGFAEIEKQNVRLNVDRVKDTLNNLLVFLESKQNDWAAWDDTYAFVQAPEKNQAYVSSNLNDETLADSLHINLMFFLNDRHEIVFQKMVDLGTGKAVAMPEEFFDLVRPDSILLDHEHEDSSVRGFIATKSGMQFAVVSQPIITSARKGPIIGHLIWGYYVTPAEMHKLSEVMHLPFELKMVKTDEKFARDDVQVKAHSENKISGTVILPDLYGQQRFSLKVEQSRAIYQQGNRAIQSIVIALVACSGFAGLMLVFFLRQMVLTPLKLLGGNLSEITRNADPSRRIPDLGNDEIGDLSRNINTMLHALESSRNRLQESQERYKFLSENIPVGIFETDLNGHCTYVNSPWCDMTGLSPGEAYGAGWVRCLHPEDSEKVFQAWYNSARDGAKFNMEYRYLRPDGSAILVYGNAQMIRVGGKTVGYLGTVTDISALKQARDELQTAQSQLLQAQKMESLGKLAGGIAHDFNNILGGILGYADLLKAKLSGDEKASRQLAVIAKSAQRGAKLTRDMLRFARRDPFEKQDFSINVVVSETLQFLDAMLEKNVFIKTVLDPNLPEIEGDPNQVMQVLVNLAINAKDAMPSGGTIIFKTEAVVIGPECNLNVSQLKSGHYIRLTVEDTGAGIPASIREKIFDPFFTTKAPGKGTGLGLSMIYGIMENHGGKVMLDSSEGGGAVFQLYFPVNMAGHEKKTNQKKDSFALSTDFSLRNKTVLIADDEPHLRQLLENILSPLGARVLQAEDGMQAVALLKQNSNVEIVILDVIMPQMDGVQAYREIKIANPKLPVVFMSGFAESQKMEEILSMEDVSFVAKPFEREAILQAIARRLS